MHRALNSFALPAVLAIVFLGCGDGSGGASDSPDAGAGDAGRTPDAGDLPRDQLIVKQGDQVGDVTIESIASFGLDELGNVHYSAWLADSSGNSIGLGVLRWTPTSHALVLSPTEIEGVLGQPATRSPLMRAASPTSWRAAAWASTAAS